MTHLPVTAMPGAPGLFADPAGSAVAAQVFGRRGPSAWAETALWSGRADIAGPLRVGSGTFGSRAAEVNGSGDVRVVVRDTGAARALNLTMSSASAGGAGFAGIGIEGVGTMIAISPTNRVGLLSQTVGTGAAAAALTANKPGASTAIATWVTLNVNGTDYVLPLWLPT
jgi:hypothetical protein